MVNEPPTIYELPKELTPKNVIHYSEHYKRLEGTEGENAIKSKAKKFLKEGCIQYDPQGNKYDEFEQKGEYEGHKFICKPIKGYNSTTYRMWQNKETKEFECSCQFHQTTKRQCSHITALWLWIKIKNWNRKNGR